MRGLEVTLGSGVGPLECACPELEWLPASRQSSHRKEGSPAPPGGCPRRTRCSLRDKDVIKLLVLLDVSACPGLVGGQCIISNLGIGFFFFLIFHLIFQNITDHR